MAQKGGLALTPISEHGRLVQHGVPVSTLLTTILLLLLDDGIVQYKMLGLLWILSLCDGMADAVFINAAKGGPPLSRCVTRFLCRH